MSDKKFGELKKMNMREAWKTEAQDFTPWLHENISALGEALGMTLHSMGREVAIGDFSLDLLAWDDDKRTVAIENQFNSTDHSHLGQLLTYAAGCNADVLIWVTEKVRDEHRAAVEWLNRKTDTETEFYLVKVEVLRIDNSHPAYQFVPVVASNKWQKRTHQATATTPEDAACELYFRQFIGELKENGFPFDVARQHFRATRYRLFSCGIPGYNWAYAHEIEENQASVYLYLEGSKKPAAEKMLAALVARDGSAEKWELTGYQGWSISEKGVYRPAAFSDSEKSLSYIRKWAVEQMFKLTESIPQTLLQEIANKLEAE